MDPEQFFFTMPRAKQFGEAERSKIMSWFDDGVTTEEIATLKWGNMYFVNAK
jgi:hypothetical protein